MATALGTVKKTALDDFSNPRKAGIIAVDLDTGDYLIGAALTDGKHDVMLFSDGGKAVRFNEDEVRPLSRTARPTSPGSTPPRSSPSPACARVRDRELRSSSSACSPMCSRTSHIRSSTTRSSPPVVR